MTTRNTNSRPSGPGGAEWLFGIGMTFGKDSPAHGTMRSGPWMTGPDGAPNAAALGVLIDDTLTLAAVLRRPPSHWLVTTEVSIDHVAPLPLDGRTLTSSGEIVSADSGGALATGTIQDESGQALALMSLRSRYVPGVPEQQPPGMPDPGSSDVPPAEEPARPEHPEPERKSLLSMLDASLEPEDGQVRLRMPGEPFLGNLRGTLHGGVALCASQLAASYWLPADEGMSIASTRITYLRGLELSGPVEFTARPVHHGRTFRLIEVTSYTASGKPATIATVSGYAGSARES